MLETLISIGKILKEIREEQNLMLQNVAKQTDINFTLLSRIETGKRLPTKEQIKKLASFYKYNKTELLKILISDKIFDEVKEYDKTDISIEALQLAEEKIKYHYSLFPDFEIENNIKLESRRFIGNKAKLTEWIMNIIEKETDTAGTFIDIFAGTASVSKVAMKKFNKIIINDILYSNNIIYKAFFKPQNWDKQKLREILSFYNSLNSNKIPENYFSENFGNKFFENNIAKKIGYIREDLEKRKSELNEKEYSILLVSLIYSIDKVANTVGHFDAYIKKPIRRKHFDIKLIETVDFNDIQIYREDANILARKIKGDIAYVDPPYNSRQYSRFYHIYETLVKWDKPKLYGVALKPKPENMSKYCTVKAKDTFKDLVENLDVKYLA
ncbi:MAG TPA: helix-turn-helix domain-containing protein, partial [Ignavibacteria bacterium]|nr:helix-turn-helix domain-containing protein [Ignavibacteria bacterium]